MLNPREEEITKCELRRMLRREATLAEKILWMHLRNRKLGYKFRRQHPIGDYIVDFYCFDKKLVIEVDGGIHKSCEISCYDKERDALIKSCGLSILRIPNEDVYQNVKNVCARIKKECDSI